MIEHRAAVNLVGWVNKTFAVGPADRLLFITSMCFDLSVYDIFGVLATGGSLVIARQEEVQDADRLQALMRTEGITFWDSVPSTMQHLVNYLEEAGGAYRQDTLRLVFMSGDWIPVQLPDRLRKYFPGAAVISLGGATEGTVWSNYFPIGEVEPAWNSIPYGRPIDNNFFYILDEQLRPVPKGVVGELYIGGVGVARGYANDAAKTAHSFKLDPFFAGLGGRMYRTGDLGRFMPDGTMEFLGRKDHQVKIRGYRVELGEVEAQLARHPLVRESAVEARRDAHNVLTLCAYVVLEKEEVPAADLRVFLAQRLPVYMLPAHFIRLPQLPLNSNGKVDRRALPAPEAMSSSEAMSSPERVYLAPRSEVERKLNRIWEKILERKQIGIRDNFFEIGGQSLNATRMMTQIYKELDVKVELKGIFSHPTIEELAAQIETIRWVKTPAPGGYINNDEEIVI
jgi:acyl-coenzyme A synthetase/AMP-(fatty) acid ligase/acyl carrier protein